MRLHPNDNVGLALTKIKENCSFENVIVKEDIPAGHKIALAEIQKGEPVRKYNQTIGFASEKIVGWFKTSPKIINTISACALVVIAIFIALANI